MEKIYRLGTSRNSKSKQKSQKFGQIVNEWGRNRSDRQKWETRSLRSVFLVKNEKAAVAACATHSHTAPLPRINPPAPHLNPHHQLFHSPRETADTVEKFIDDNTRQNCILVQCVPHWKISPKKKENKRTTARQPPGKLRGAWVALCGWWGGQQNGNITCKRYATKAEKPPPKRKSSTQAQELRLNSHYSHNGCGCVRACICVWPCGCMGVWAQKKNENELRRIIKATEAPIPVSVTKNTGASNT